MLIRPLRPAYWAPAVPRCPALGMVTIDLDSTVCETFGLCKEGAQRHNYAGQRGYAHHLGRGPPGWNRRLGSGEQVGHEVGAAALPASPSKHRGERLPG